MVRGNFSPTSNPVDFKMKEPGTQHYPFERDLRERGQHIQVGEVAMEGEGEKEIERSELRIGTIDPDVQEKIEETIKGQLIGPTVSQ